MSNNSLTYNDRQNLQDFVREGYFDENGVFVKVDRNTSLFRDISILVREEVLTKLMQETKINAQKIQEIVEDPMNLFNDVQVRKLTDLSLSQSNDLRLLEQVVQQLDSLD